jgi:ABC-type lipoprotein export system ATPase subunit
MLRLRDVVKVYSTGSGGFTALNDINLDIFQGEFLGITGKSGAGKTTLLNMISGVSTLTSGEVLFYNHQNSNGKNGFDSLAVGTMNENE